MSVSKIFWKGILTAFGLGKLPLAPGTWGTLGALVVYFYLFQLGWNILILTSLVALFALSLLGFHFLNIKTDDSEIVMDEWVAMGMTLFATDGSWQQAIFAFVLFRIFDITKPPGVKFFDRRFLSGWGVMLDDIVAALYAMAIIGAWNAFGPFV